MWFQLKHQFSESATDWCLANVKTKQLILATKQFKDKVTVMSYVY